MMTGHCEMLRKLGCKIQAAYACLRRFAQDQRGVSAVEFALLLPVMVIIYAGIADVARGVDASRKVNRIASVVGDLVSRQIKVIPAQLDDIFLIGATIMAPSLKAPEIKISFLKVEQVRGNFVVTLDWSRKTRGFDDRKGKGPTELPENLRKEVMNYIRVETQYTYVPLNSYVLPPIEMAETYYVSPRYTNTIPCEACR
jgi:Flp pilus assembly protein TadG